MDRMDRVVDDLDAADRNVGLPRLLPGSALTNAEPRTRTAR